MEILSTLWLPTLLSAVGVFIVSSILHMAIPIHKGDYKKMPGEAAVLETMRGQSIAPGEYMFPCASSMKEMGTPEMVEKLNQGPVGTMIVQPNGPPNMLKSLVQWFVYSIVISFCVAYVATLSQGRGAEYMDVFRVTGTVAILCYAIGHGHDSIWKARSWVVTFKFVFDGVIYGLVTAGVFAWLWPGV